MYVLLKVTTFPLVDALQWVEVDAVVCISNKFKLVDYECSE